MAKANKVATSMRLRADHKAKLDKLSNESEFKAAAYVDQALEALFEKLGFTSLDQDVSKMKPY